LSLKYTNFRL